MGAVKYKGRIISLVTAQRRLPNGIKTKLEIVLHPGAVLIIPFLNPQQIIFIRQYRPVIKQYLLELPAGTLKSQENPLFCAKRELSEETGYGAKKFTKIGRIFPVPGYSTEIITIYKAERLMPHPAQQDHDEMIDICPLHKNQIKKLFKAGKIIDAKTICALSLSGLLS